MRKRPEKTPIADGYVTTARLAELFQVTPKTIFEWRKLGRPVPEKVDGKEDLAAWRSYFAANPQAGHGDGKPRKDRESLMCEKLEVDIAIARVKYEEAMRVLVAAAEVRESATRMYSVVRGELLKLSSDLPPRLSGLSESEMQKIIKADLIEILRFLSDETNDLYQPTAG